MNKKELLAFIGAKIRDLRLEHGLTQEEFGQRVGLTRQSVYHYEKGIRDAGQDVLFKIADYFHVSIDYFFPDDHHAKSRSDQDKERIREAVSKGNQVTKMIKLIELANEISKTNNDTLKSLFAQFVKDHTDLDDDIKNLIYVLVENK